MKTACTSLAILGLFALPISPASATQPPAHCKTISVVTQYQALTLLERTITTQKCRGQLSTVVGPWHLVP
jgi:hypothetical protein